MLESALFMFRPPPRPPPWSPQLQPLCLIPEFNMRVLKLNYLCQGPCVHVEEILSKKSERFNNRDLFPPDF